MMDYLPRTQFRIMEFFRGSRHEWTPRDVSVKLGILYPHTHNSLEALRKAGYLAKRRGRKADREGNKVFYRLK